MKMFYLVDGNKYEGPFDFEELRYRKITSNTPIWFQGIKRWTEAGKIEIMRALIHQQPSISELNTTASENSNSTSPMANVLGIMLFLGLIFISIWVLKSM
jgi:hypothetical protein